MFEEGAKSRHLATAFRHLEHLGFVQRVKAQPNTSAEDVKFHRCLKLINQPSEQQIESFLSSDFEWKAPFQPDVGSAGTLDQNAFTLEGDADGPEVWPPSFEYGEHVEQMGGSISSWSPDRQLAHTLCDVLEHAPAVGASLMVRLDSCPPVQVTYNCRIYGTRGLDLSTSALLTH